MSRYSMILARSLDGTIGLANGDLPFKQKADMQHFKRTTTGHVIVVGRTTWETFRNRPLPNRTTVVLSSKPQDVMYAFETARCEAGISHEEANVAFMPGINPDSDFSWARQDHLFDLDAETPEHCDTNYEDKPIFICGGGAVYQHAIEKLEVDVVYVTEIESEFYETDAVRFTHDFDVDPHYTLVEVSETFPADENNEYSYRFKTYVRKR